MKDYNSVNIQKPDLDTCMTALVMGVSATDCVAVLNGNASEDELRNPAVLCIEVGGSGLVHLNNFDHHDPDKYYPPACQQAYEYKAIKDEKLHRLVSYVCIVDDRPEKHPSMPFPSLSSIFSGMLLAEKEPLKQFFSGIEILQTALVYNIDPFKSVPDLESWRFYKEEKYKNQCELDKILQQAEFYVTNNGTMIGYLESSVIGGIGALYAQGCEVVIVYNPCFGTPPVKKYTIASQNMKVAVLLKELDKVENGWGGRETIIGSPRIGSALNKNQILNLIKRLL